MTTNCKEPSKLPIKYNLCEHHNIFDDNTTMTMNNDYHYYYHHNIIVAMPLSDKEFRSMTWTSGLCHGLTLSRGGMKDVVLKLVWDGHVPLGLHNETSQLGCFGYVISNRSCPQASSPWCSTLRGIHAKDFCAPWSLPGGSKHIVYLPWGQCVLISAEIPIRTLDLEV